MLVMGKIASIQILRALAVSLVVLYHSTTWFPVGGFGVDIFFVVSGFIIATVVPGQSAKDFLIRRWWRIYPIYWLLSVPLILSMHTSVARTAASLTLWPVWGDAMQYPYLPVAWTLYCEVLFYLAAAVAIFDWRVPLVGFAIAMIVNGLTGNPIASHLGNPMFFEFLAGVLLTRVPRRPVVAAAGLTLAIGALLAAPNDQIIKLAVLTGSGGFHRLLWWGIPAILIAYSALAFDSALRRAQWAVKLGDASYAIYLVFAPITVLLVPYGSALAFTAAILAGLLVHNYVERPLLSIRLPAKQYVVQ